MLGDEATKQVLFVIILQADARLATTSYEMFTAQGWALPVLSNCIWAQKVQCWRTHLVVTSLHSKHDAPIFSAVL